MALIKLAGSKTLGAGGIGLLRHTIGPKVEDPDYRYKAPPGAFEMPAPPMR